jgi:hypothetical protein
MAARTQYAEISPFRNLAGRSRQYLCVCKTSFVETGRGRGKLGGEWDRENNEKLKESRRANEQV